MRRFLRPLLAVLVLTLLAGGAWALSGGDSLISLQYWKETMVPKAVQAGETAANGALQGAYDKAKSDLDQARQEVTGGKGGPYSETLQQREWSEGQTITLPTGSSFLMLQGSAAVSHNGAVVDVTEGNEVPSGAVLAANHRYLVGEGTSAEISVLSGYAAMGVQGSYTVSSGAADPLPFYDVSTADWYYAPVRYVYEEGLFSGLEAHRFGPDSAMTRAMLMTVLYQLAGAPGDELAAADVTLSDVADGMWYASYVKWGVSQGIASGTGGDTFSPDRQITREQMVVMLYSFAANYLGLDMGAGADLSAYGDQEQVSGWARQAMAWAVGEGIVSGSSNGDVVTLKPQASASRAQVATMLRAFAEKI